MAIGMDIEVRDLARLERIAVFGLPPQAEHPHVLTCRLYRLLARLPMDRTDLAIILLQEETELILPLPDL